MAAAGRNIRDDFAEVKKRRRSEARRENRRSRYNGASLFRRFSKSRDQSGGRNRWFLCEKNFAGTDGGRACLRVKQKEGREDRCLRFRRRNFRCFGFGSKLGYGRGAGDRRRYPSRRRRSRSDFDQLSRRRIQKNRRHRSFEGRSRSPAAQGGNRDSKARIA